ncbi:MAG: alpha/beta family hydrolase [Phycisphaeraceae bacterium]
MSEPRTGAREVRVPVGKLMLPGLLTVPEGALGLVAFAHGGGSGRHSSRNRPVAGVLHEAGLATLLFDLLSDAEHRTDERTRHLRFDIHLLAERLTMAVDWLRAQDATREMHVGLFGASTGAAAALITAARRPGTIDAVVSRGGRTDLAGNAITQVRAPTLLIVGDRDEPIIEANRQSAEQLRVEHRVHVVPGASHLFEEPGALDDVARVAQVWFRQHLVAVHDRAR